MSDAGRRLLGAPRARALGLAVALLALALALGLPGSGEGQQGGGANALPTLGPADFTMTLMGSSPEETAGETWGYDRLALDIPPPVVDGQPLRYGTTSGGVPQPQLAFLRYTHATGWQVFATPVDETGQPYRGLLPNPLSPRTTPRGGALLVGRDSDRVGDAQVVVIGRDPGGRFAILPAPKPGVLKPAVGGQPAEALAGDRGSGAVVDTAFDENGKLGAFFAPIGPDVQDGVVHYDGSKPADPWSREEIRPPPGGGRFEIVALAATEPRNAWMLARPAGASRGIVLHERKRDAITGQHYWEERDIGASEFSQRETPALGVSAVQPLGGNAESLTATTGGVWIDGSLEAGGNVHDFTLFFDPASGPGRVTGSWCDAPRSDGTALCNHRLGVSFSRRDGYRSFAWSGGGFGSRIVTNPLDPGGSDESNRGTYLRFDGPNVRRGLGGGGNRRRAGAFSSAEEGWLQGPVHITQSGLPDRFTRWPVPGRAPLNAVAPEPGKPRADPDSSALAVGGDGTVLRYAPGRGWNREFLLTSAGTVARPLLRGVAWPDSTRAHAVGDLGSMWLWRSVTGEWERDPGTPVGLDAHLTDVAFDPGDGERGYAVGRGGTLLRYDKSWIQEGLPGGFAGADFYSIAFAGSQALIAAGPEVLSNDGSGWKVEPGIRALLSSVRDGAPRIYTVAGLPDGGAIAAGRNIVLQRDSAGAPWRFADQPLPGSTVVAAAAYRDGGRVRAMVSVQPRLTYPNTPELPPPDPNVPTPILPPIPPAADGYLLRESHTGWRDEQNTSFSGTSTDRPVKSDPVLDLLVDSSGNGWTVGGWSGHADSAGRGSSGGGSGRADRQRVQTAGVYRYSSGGGAAGPPATVAAPIVMPAGPVRFAVGGHAQCEQRCADLANQAIGPDRWLDSAVAKGTDLAGRPDGPRALLYTGGRTKPGSGPQPQAEADRLAALLARSGPPVFAAPSAGDTEGGKADPFRSAFSSFASPFGRAGDPPGVASAFANGAGSGARTHYAFDSGGSGGTVRVVVIDNSAGSLEASDPHQNPPEPQRPWLASVLADAQARGIPSVVMGSRDLNSRFNPRINVATDADQTAQMLVDGGASAYVYERPEETRALRIPSGGADTIPEYGTGTLGYRSPLSSTTQPNQPDQLFGASGFLLLEVHASQRVPNTNRAPVGVRFVPLIDDLALEAVDGTLLRRSRPALFRGLGRRPVAGDRWGPASSDGNASPAGGDPYIPFPPELCFAQGCSTRVTPDYEFRSSDPEVGDFVKQDPLSPNLRKPLQDAQGRVVSDPSSGLFCAFNPGSTTTTVTAGGLTYSVPVTVLAGSVQQPCGTRPRAPARVRRELPLVTPPSQPKPSPSPSDPPDAPLVPPPAPAPAPVAAGSPGPPSAATPVVKPTLSSPPVPPSPTVPALLVGVPPPQPPALGRPVPPSGAPARVFQVEEKREEEAAPEQSQASSRYEPDQNWPVAPFLLGAAVLAAVAGATIAGGLRRRDRRYETAAVAASSARLVPRPPAGGRHRSRPNYQQRKR